MKMKFFKPFYIQPRFFYCGIAIVVLFICSYFLPILFNVAQLSILVVLTFFFLDFLIVFIGKNRIEAQRILPDKFSNGDDNTVQINITNNYPFITHCTIIDEIPVQFQVRDFELNLKLSPRKTKSITYNLKPTQRGEYHFGSLNIYFMDNESQLPLLLALFSPEDSQARKYY